MTTLDLLNEWLKADAELKRAEAALKDSTSAHCDAVAEAARRSEPLGAALFGDSPFRSPRPGHFFDTRHFALDGTIIRVVHVGGNNPHYSIDRVDLEPSEPATLSSSAEA